MNFDDLINFLEADSEVTIMSHVQHKEFERLNAEFSGHHLIGRNPAGYLMFAHEGELFTLLPDGQILEMRGKWALRGSETQPETRATRLDLPYDAIRHQDVPGGVLVTGLLANRSALINGRPTLFPVTTFFLPGVYLAHATNGTERALVAVKTGLTLENVGLQPVESEAPTMGGKVMG